MSTRGAAPALDFAGVVVSGPAADGGLYVPQAWPRLSEAELCALQGASYGEIARRVMLPFVGDSLDEATLADLIAEAYAGFDHAAVAPLRQLDPATWLLELFHGPTLAFKDCALQVLGRLLEHFLERGGRRLTVIAATSGDTGSAAIEACRERAGIDIFVLHPKGRVSEVQRRQMTTVTSRNVHNIAIEGTFDDCQALVKRLFADTGFRNDLALGAVNSINWARIVAQIVYYVAAALALDAPRRRVAFSVPTGNFGDVYAGYGAARLGLPVDRLVVATNSNDILARFFERGDYAPSEAVATMSPSMDIQVASNFERLLFDLFDGDGAAVARRMRTSGRCRVVLGRSRADRGEGRPLRRAARRRGGDAGGHSRDPGARRHRRRPAHRGRHRRRARGRRSGRGSPGVPGDRASGQVPRGRRTGLAIAAAGRRQDRRPVRTRGTLRGTGERRRDRERLHA